MSSGKQPPKPPEANPAIQQVNTPTLFETLANKKLQDWSDWENSAGPHDITQAPGMGDIEDIYGNADAMAAEKRLGGNPGQALSGGGSGDFQAQLAQLGQNQRYQARAEGLSHGLQSLKDQAYGYGGNAASLESARKTAYADDMLKQQEAYYNRPKPKPLWERIAGLAIGGLGAAGGIGGLKAI